MENWINGLTAETRNVFEQVSNLECIKNLYLCGGTAISLQLLHRKSEDLDFEQLVTFGEKKDLDVSGICSELQIKFPNLRREILGYDHFLIYLENNVKLSFFRPANRVPVLNKGFVHNNLKTVSKQDLLGMKLFTICVRNVFRDYYDIYSLLKDGCSLKDGIEYACNFSRHKIHSKQILSSLQMPSLFVADSSFKQLEPVYNVDGNSISEFIKDVIIKESQTFKFKP